MFSYRRVAALLGAGKLNVAMQPGPQPHPQPHSVCRPCPCCSWIVGRILLFIKFFHHVATHLGEFRLVGASVSLAVGL